MNRIMTRLLSSVCFAPETGEGSPDPSAEERKSIAELLNFDFIPPEEKPEGSKAEGGEVSKEEPQAKPDKVEAGATTVEEKPAEVPTVDPKDAALAALNDTIKSLLARKEPEPRKEEPRDEVPDFVKEYSQVSIPKTFLAKMNSDDEDERLDALNGLTRSLLIRAAHDARKYYDDKIAALRSEVPQLATSTIEAERAREQIQQEFFSEYPMLAKTPMLKQLALQTAYTVGLEEQQAGRAVAWNQEFRKKVAERVVADLGGKLQPPSAAKPNGARRPAFVAGAGARQSSERSLTDDIMDVVSPR